MGETTVLSNISYPKNPMLLVIYRNCTIETYYLRGNMILGRGIAGQDVDIAIQSSIVSRVHGTFCQTEGGYVYRDMNSSNGTYINGNYYGTMAGNCEKWLQDGDVLKIDGNVHIGSHSEAVLLIYRDRIDVIPQWNCIDLNQQNMEINIGRDDSANSVAFGDTRISSNHATFFLAQDGWAITDNHSTNGVFLNNTKIQMPLYLNNLDCVRIVDNLFIYIDNKLLYSVTCVENSYNNRPIFNQQKDTYSNEMEYVAKSNIGDSLYINIVKRTTRKGLFKRLTLLRDINLTVNAGEMVLILGGSGAGKTTFMNAVMGYEKATGSIRHGEVDIYSQYKKMKYSIGFVPQDVLVRESDTVYETLYNAAEMKMPHGTTTAMRRQRVQEVLEMVNLTHVSRSLVKSISGGEKKRVSAGVELVADPSLFFLDEPDSGLDAQSAIELMENLRNIANMGKIVIVISHSPDRVSHLFDKVIVLAKSKVDNSGHLAFYGSVSETVDFFETSNLEGVVGKINGRDGRAELYIQKWNEIKQNRQNR